MELLRLTSVKFDEAAQRAAPRFTCFDLVTNPSRKFGRRRVDISECIDRRDVPAWNEDTVSTNQGCLFKPPMMQSPVSSSWRSERVVCLVAALGVIGLGLIWRSPIFEMPAPVKKYGGDALWAVLVYLLIRFL